MTIADQSNQLAFASLKKMIESETWESLRPVALCHAAGLQQFCLTAAGGTLIEERKSAYISYKLELLVRQNLIEKFDYPQMLHWTQKETRTPATPSGTALTGPVAGTSCGRCSMQIRSP